MQQVYVKIEGYSPLCFGKFHDEEKLRGEIAKDYEKRTWRKKLHVNKNGNVVIRSNAIKNCLAAAAKYASIQIPGKGKATYTKHFEAGLLVKTDLDLKINHEDDEKINKLELFVPSDGRRGGTKRVIKYFPEIPVWNGIAEMYILDDIITKEVLQEHLRIAGAFIGLGSFRPRNNGDNGRFLAEIIEFKEISRGKGFKA